MKINKIIILAFILFLLIMAFSFYFLFLDSSSNESSLINEIVKEKQVPIQGPIPIQVPIEKAPESLATKTNDSQSEVIKVAEPVLRKVNLDKDPKKEIAKIEEHKNEVIVESLYQPIFDHFIVRSHAKAFFILYDAKGKLLEPKIVTKVRIWRNVRENLWLEDDANFNHETSVLECDGFGRQGLEPGRYSVYVDGGGYGTLEFNFQINKDEEYHSTFQMPHFTRVIAVHFVDPEDNNVEYIRSLPTYISNKNEEPIFKFHPKKFLVLRNSPAVNEKNNFSNADKIDEETAEVANLLDAPFFESQNLVYQTNKGKMYLRIFSDQLGEISYNYNKLGSLPPFLIKSKFEDKEVVKILIKQPTKLNQRTKIVTFDASQNDDTKGINIYNKLSINKEERPLVVDHKTKGFHYQLKRSKFPLQLEYKNAIGISGTILEDGFKFQRIFAHTEIEDAINIRLVDKKIFRSPWEPITLEKGRMVFKEGEFPLQKFQLNFILSPTFFEMAKGFAEIRLSDNLFALEYSNTNLFFESFFIENSPLFNENVSDLTFNIISKIGDFRTATRSPHFSSSFLPKGFVYKTEIDSFYRAPLKINTSEVVTSNSKMVENAPLENVLILRAIDLNVSGLPWVEASLIKYEDRRTALEVNRILSDSVNYDFTKSLRDKDLNVTSDSEMNELVSKKLHQIFPFKKEFDYFLANGSWYNPSDRSISDSAGYLILKTENLIPGKNYSLFLWCQSGDELKPDKEIIFKAKEGITDLGAIRFY